MKKFSYFIPYIKILILWFCLYKIYNGDFSVLSDVPERVFVFAGILLGWISYPVADLYDAYENFVSYYKKSK